MWKINTSDDSSVVESGRQCAGQATQHEPDATLRGSSAHACLFPYLTATSMRVCSSFSAEPAWADGEKGSDHHMHLACPAPIPKRKKDLHLTERWPRHTPPPNPKEKRGEIMEKREEMKQKVCNDLYEHTACMDMALRRFPGPRSSGNGWLSLVVLVASHEPSVLFCSVVFCFLLLFCYIPAFFLKSFWSPVLAQVHTSIPSFDMTSKIQCAYTVRTRGEEIVMGGWVT